MGRAYGLTGRSEKGESDMHLHGTKRDRSECVVCCFPLYKLFFFLLWRTASVHPGSEIAGTTAALRGWRQSRHDLQSARTLS